MATKTISLKRTGGILPDGIYKARIESAEFRNGAKTDFLACKFKDIRSGMQFFDNVMMMESMRGRLEAFLDAIEAPASGSLTPAKLVKLATGKVVYVRLGEDEYNGQKKNKVLAYIQEETALKLMEDQPAQEDEEFEEDAEEDTEEGDDDWDDDDDDDNSVDNDKNSDGSPF